MTTNTNWSFPAKFLFRFFFVYFIIFAEPWTLVENIPYGEYLFGWYRWLIDKIVHFANDHLFHTYKELVPVNGSGDTSWAYTHLQFFLLFSLAVAIIWSVADRKKNAYPRWNYILVTTLRYYIATICFGYGIIKLFALQMIFPSLSQLATPLGEFLPMRFSWLFIGYSSPYQIFSGVMEVVAGLLLFNRKTVTAGVLMATGVFMHVMVLNLAYDIPVKIFSTHLVAICIFLAVQDYQRIAAFFFLNKTTSPNQLYEPIFYTRKWQKITRIVLKSLFVLLIIILPLIDGYSGYQQKDQAKEQLPIRSGIYDVNVFAVNADTLPPLIGDSTRWSQVILHPGTSGSMISSDTLFRKLYGRSYFGYYVDTTKQELVFRRSSRQSDSLFSFNYAILDSTTIQLKGKRRQDSLYIILKRNNKQYRLAEKQFHWLSEYNR
jgi:hypothetical protein